ncbi:MAG: endonuclease III [Thermomicrobiales bacterium]|nr:endonuclease III [Thermomicrobiales bacterium]
MRSSKPVPIEVCQKIDDVWLRLGEHYGHPELRPTGDPLGQLVMTVLSQHTTDAGAERAYSDLRAAFPDWASIESAPVEDVAAAIRFAGLANQKANTIQRVLRELQPDDLATDTTRSVPAARARLTAVRGIGDKTASCVLLFALGIPAQPVDTHIQRVSTRIGITNGEKTATGIQNVFEACLPPDSQTMYAFHVDMVRHGRQVCTARAPKCSMCVLSEICDFSAASRSVTT